MSGRDVAKLAPSQPRERGIIMTGPSVPAVLAGVKTQTRRITEGAPADTYEVVPSLLCHRGDLWDFRRQDKRGVPHNPVAIRCPYGAVGDRLWIRESWRTEELASDGTDGIRYQADDAFIPIASTAEAADRWVDAHRNGAHGKRWRPALYVPRWASRATLEITEVRVQRLQQVSEADAIAEGVEAWEEQLDTAAIRTGAELAACRRADRRAWFAALWQELHGPGAWGINPWVWAIRFRRLP